jgi:hypothetical protein
VKTYGIVQGTVVSGEDLAQCLTQDPIAAKAYLIIVTSGAPQPTTFLKQYTIDDHNTYTLDLSASRLPPTFEPTQY